MRPKRLQSAGEISQPAKIIAVAARLFQQEGFEKTTTRDIARDAGMTSGMIFYYFESKDRLLEEVISQGIRVGLELVERRLSASRGPLNRYRAAIRSHLELVTGDLGAAHKVSFREWRSLSQEARDRVRVLSQRYREIWVDLLRRLAEAGHLRSEVEFTRRAIIGALNWSPFVKIGVSSGPNVVADNICATFLNMPLTQFIDACDEELKLSQSREAESVQQG